MDLASVAAFAAIAVAVCVGSAVQSVAGLGIGLVAAPVMALLEPSLMPGSLILLALVLPCLTLVHDHADIDWAGLAWSLPARVVGTGVGVWAVTSFGDRQLGIAVGAIVLAMVVVTARMPTIAINGRTLSAAGFVGGITGTATSIGGPPYALLYQHRPPTQIRTTMAVYFLLGAALSIVGLVLSRDLHLPQLLGAAQLLPAVVVGVVGGALLRRRVRAEQVRPLVLGVSALSAVVLLVRSLAG